MLLRLPPSNFATCSYGSFLDATFKACIKLTPTGSVVKAKASICPALISMQGYGFSSAPTHRGFGVKQMGDTVDALMSALGYPSYLAQGGDWGGIICRALAM
jgi:hypothetical protein